MSTDLSAAFDGVEHKILKEKLKMYGLDGQTHKWIKSYLEARSSYVVIGSAESRIFSNPHGVLQGSVLGPLLYMIYVNELPSAIEDNSCTNGVHKDRSRLFPKECTECGSYMLYPDDGVYRISSHYRNYNQDKIDMVFWKVKVFLNANGLKVNNQKTKLTEFMTHQKRAKTGGIPPDLTIREETKDRRGQIKWQDKLITDNPNCRILNMNLNRNLSWDNHLNTGKKALLPALRRQIGMISRLGQAMSKKAKLKLVNCLVINRLQYGLCLWGNTSKKQISTAQVVVNTAARMITGQNRTTRQETLMKECSWMKVEDMTEYSTLLQFWKIAKWGLPTYIEDIITREPEDKMSTTIPRLQLTEMAYRWTAVRKWNQLPGNLREEDIITRFKRGLKEWISKRTEDNNQQRDRPP